MIGKKRPDEPKKRAEIPEKAGSPDMAVRKTWKVGDFRVTLEDGRIFISDQTTPYAALHNSLNIRKEYAAAIADALLQAS